MFDLVQSGRVPSGRAVVLSLLAVLLFTLTNCSGKPYPEQTGFVTDGAGILEPAAAKTLAQRLAAYEKETCHRFFVLIVPSLGGDEIAAFSQRIVDGWKIAPPPLESGLLLTVAMDDGKARVDAGKGLQSLVNSGRAEEILRREILPLFAENRYAQGLERGLSRLMEEGRLISYAEQLRPDYCR